MGPDKLPVSICLLTANDWALLTRPSISAPLKFFVLAAVVKWEFDQSLCPDLDYDLDLQLHFHLTLDQI